MTLRYRARGVGEERKALKRLIEGRGGPGPRGLREASSTGLKDKDGSSEIISENRPNRLVNSSLREPQK